LSAFRVMSQATLKVYQTIRQQGSQQSLVKHMQTRAELYDILNYYRYENQQDLVLKAQDE